MTDVEDGEYHTSGSEETADTEDALQDVDVFDRFGGKFSTFAAVTFDDLRVQLEAAFGLLRTRERDPVVQLCVYWQNVEDRQIIDTDGRMEMHIRCRMRGHSVNRCQQAVGTTQYAPFFPWSSYNWPNPSSVEGEVDQFHDMANLCLKTRRFGVTPNIDL